MADSQNRLRLFGFTALAVFFFMPLAYGKIHSDTSFYFYRGKPYGSESLINPITLILQGGYGILKIESRSPNPADVDYRTGWKNLSDNLLHPLKHIRNYGVHAFIYEQIIPFSVHNQKAYYWPNYTMHVIGGGMSFRMMVEWFRYHGYPQPVTLSLATITIYHLLNEVVENNDFVGTNVDPIADVYIFNPLGIVLFSLDPVARFFSETLSLSDWSFQIAYDPWCHHLVNNGQNFMMRLPLTRSKRIHLLYVFGNHGEIGASYRINHTDYVSLVGGLSAQRLVKMRDDTDVLELTTSLVGSAGLFYDRDRSLLFSVLYTVSRKNRFQINLYPGILPTPKIQPGLFFILGKNGRGAFGLTWKVLPLQPARHF